MSPNTRVEYQRLISELNRASREVGNSLDRPERLVYWLEKFQAIQWKLYEFHCNCEIGAMTIPLGYAEEVIVEWEGELDETA